MCSSEILLCPADVWMCDHCPDKALWLSCNTESPSMRMIVKQVCWWYFSKCGLKHWILPYSWWQFICISQGFKNMILLWPPFSCKSAGKTFKREKQVSWCCKWSWSLLALGTISNFAPFKRKKIKKTFVSSFGVYFGDPVVSFSDVTVVKQARTRQGVTTTANATINKRWIMWSSFRQRSNLKHLDTTLTFTVIISTVLVVR